ncbi:hypothetical protein D9758_014498 [Tetrapyrgos nigripes]|uniref:Uncharacterized protein n=1 Tax=Tetrapyrgos nigripes TaxID=182062 RepID=A0A8H5C945_9AGAR|nr:hypothetical protein D9758_014498 [Tetrapyrgos nigripes]
MTPTVEELDTNHQLLLHRPLQKKGRSPTAYDASLAAVLPGGSLFLTTPYQDLPVYQVEPIVEGMTMRRDFRFGQYDYLQWPQQWCQQLCHIACILRRPPPGHQFDVMWWTPTIDCFKEECRGIASGLGKLRAGKAEELRLLVAELRGRCSLCIASHENETEVELAQQCSQRLLERMNRLHSLLLTFRQICYTIASLQRLFLELHALLEYCTIYKPRMAGKSLPASIAAAVVGAWTSNLEAAEALFRAGIPFWFLRRVDEVPAVSVGKLASLVVPDNLCLDNAPFPEPIIYRTGVPNTELQYSAIHKHLNSAFNTYSPFESSAESRLQITPPSALVLSGPQRTTPSKSRHHPYPKSPKNASSSARDKFHLVSHSLFLTSPCWGPALSRVNQSNPPVPIQGGYAFPDPSLFVTVQKREKMFKYCWNWLQFRDVLLFRVTQPSPRLIPNSTWRQILNGELTSTTQPSSSSSQRPSRTASAKATARDLLGNCLLSTGVEVDLENPPSFVMWREQSFSEPSDISEKVAQEIIWEVAQLNFRCELRALDQALTPRLSDEQRLEQSARLSACFLGADVESILTVEFDWADGGFAAKVPSSRKKALFGLRDVMKRWPKFNERCSTASGNALEVTFYNDSALEVFESDVHRLLEGRATYFTTRVPNMYGSRDDALGFTSSEMGRTQRTTTCTKCSEYPNGHPVLSRDYAEHLLNRHNDAQTPSVMAPTASTPEGSMDQLTSLLTAVTVSDPGPDIHKQPTKLFTSREEFQRDIKIDTSGNKIGFGDIEQGLNSVVNVQPPTEPPASHHPSLSRRASRVSLSLIRKICNPKLVRMVRSINAVKDEAISIRENLLQLTRHNLDFSDKQAVLKRQEALKQANTRINQLSATLLSMRKLSDPSYTSAAEEARSELRKADSVLSIIGMDLPSPEGSSAPTPFSSDYLFENPLAGVGVATRMVIFLTVACALVIGISHRDCDFIVSAVWNIVAAATSLFCPSSAAPTSEQHVQRQLMAQLPSSLYTALNALRLDSKTTVFAPEFSQTAVKAQYPDQCNNMIVGKDGRSACGTSLLHARNGNMRPIKPYAVNSLQEHLARILANPELEKYCDTAVDEALRKVNGEINGGASNEPMTSVFDGDFLRQFTGPGGVGTLFIDRGDKARLALALQVDFFNPNGNRHRGKTASIGLVSFAILNLPHEIRNKPENLFLAAIIPGPREPNDEDFSNYMTPIIDMCLPGWKGVHLSRTGKHQEGRAMQYAVVLSVNDLPAARKVAGAAGHTSGWCTVCQNYHRTYNTCFEQWVKHDVQELRRLAEASRDANCSAERQAIFEASGVRWSELWRLPYWDPTKMLVVDSMHCVLEGLVHYHCRHVLGINAEAAGKEAAMDPAFHHNWKLYDELQVPKAYQLDGNKLDSQLKSVSNIHDLLEAALECNEGVPDTMMLRKRLSTKRLPPLRFVAWSLGIHETRDREKFAQYAKRKNPRKAMRKVKVIFNNEVITPDVPQPRKVKVIFNNEVVIPVFQIKSIDAFVDVLIEWRLKMPFVPSESKSDSHIDVKSIQHIQHVINNTSVPSWVNTVPHNYSEKVAGTIKADEWRTLVTIHLPIALVSLWDWDEDKASLRTRKVLDHTMKLFQAVNIVCRFTMSDERAKAYVGFLKEWVDDLYALHPHTQGSRRIRPNVHVAFHIYDFLKLFGPVISWWTFPFERLVGALQKINTNDHIGGEYFILQSSFSFILTSNFTGELEQTILHTFSRAANFRRLVSRPDCDEMITQFQELFDKAYGSRSDQFESYNDFAPNSKTDSHVYYKYAGVFYSRAKTHLGNSFVRYVHGNQSHVGSIQEIKNCGEHVVFIIQRQLPLPSGEREPFRFPWYPARTFSTKTSTELHTISPSAVVCHVARYQYSADRVVVVDLARD